jgi:hypothetical protein
VGHFLMWPCHHSRPFARTPPRLGVG